MSNLQKVPLKLFWNPSRGDNFTTASKQGERDAEAAGYYYARVEGYAYRDQQAGMKPLRLFWSGSRSDNFTTASEQGKRDAEAAGYRAVRTEGYVYRTPQPNTVPLKLFWSGSRSDNFITATEQGERDAEAAGYRLVRIEGYVEPAFETLKVISPNSSHDYRYDAGDHIVFDVEFNHPVQESSVRVGDTLVLKTDKVPNAGGNLVWAANRKRVTFTSYQTKNELIEFSPDGFFDLDLYGKSSLENSIVDDQGTCLDGDADGAEGGNFKQVFVDIG